MAVWRTTARVYIVTVTAGTRVGVATAAFAAINKESTNSLANREAAQELHGRCHAWGYESRLAGSCSRLSTLPKRP